MPETAPPLISVVIAAYNAQATLVACLDSVLAQTYSPFELLVVDDGSTDSTAEILRQHPLRERFRTLSVNNGGQSRARNLAVAECAGEWVAFFDADCLLAADCLESLARAIGNDEKLASVGGMQRSPADDTDFGKSVQGYLDGIGFMMEYGREGEPRVTETRHNPSCCVLYRRRVFEQLGGYDEGLWVAEDPDLDRRATEAGFRHLAQPAARVAHYRPGDAAGFGRKMIAYGRGQMMLVRRHGMHRLLHWVPVAIVASAALEVVGFALWPTVTVVASGLVLGLVWIGLERRRRRVGLGIVFYRLFWINLTRWLAGFFAELFFPRLAGPPRLHSFEAQLDQRNVEPPPGIDESTRLPRDRD